MKLNYRKNTLDISNKLKSEIAIRRARFAKIYDYDGNKFFDFYLFDGSIIFGYNYKPISKILKNTISYGFLNYYPNHLELRAKKIIKSVYPGYEFYFFYSLDSIKKWFYNSGIEPVFITYNQYSENIDNSSILYLGNRTLRTNFKPEIKYIILSPAIANGLEVYAFGIRESEDLYVKEDKLPLIYYQSIITTISEYIKYKDIFDNIYLKKLFDYKNNINYLGGGIFTLNDLNISEFRDILFKHCIYIEKGQNEIFLCLKTEEHQIKYLFKVLKKIKNGVIE
ncbi:MAG TPA: hypothetical protein PKW55_00790 [Spirochaetota bacterium]|nr:hypothetical protein [Spirochaetota bacterium]HOM39033.1 hypothetical protein [Spirochaetota bacterium]HPQ49914.1 hypothetical protein [Spirochaetota bacterium]